MPDALQTEIRQPNFAYLIRQFLHNQLHPNLNPVDSDTRYTRLPEIRGKITIYPSAVATFYAPSDISGIGGMRRERIRAVSSWRHGPPRHDCVFVNTDPSAEGMRGLDIGRVRLFFSFNHSGIKYPCALIHRYSRVGDAPDEDTGMWIVKPDIDPDSGLTSMAVIHLNTIIRAAHLLGVCGKDYLPRDLSLEYSLDAFYEYYVNKFIDHHAFEIAF
jgi:hypothetical protein